MKGPCLFHRKCSCFEALMQDNELLLYAKHSSSSRTSANEDCTVGDQ